jgi:hypothetical protein
MKKYERPLCSEYIITARSKPYSIVGQEENEVYQWYCAEALPIVNDDWGCQKIQASRLMSSFVTRSDEALVYLLITQSLSEWVSSVFSQQEIESHQDDIKMDTKQSDIMRKKYLDALKMDQRENGIVEKATYDDKDYLTWEDEDDLNGKHIKFIDFLKSKKLRRCDAECGMYAYSLSMKVFKSIRECPHLKTAEEAYKDVAVDLLTSIETEKQEKQSVKKKAKKTLPEIDYSCLFG